MADYTSFQCSAVDLLCTEETNGFCFGDDYDEPSDEQKHQNEGEKGTSFGNGGSDLVPFVHLQSLSEECFAWMLEREKEHLPGDDYVRRLRSGELDVRIRKDSLDWMIKACTYFKFGVLSLHTAISFFDRFISCFGLHMSSSLERRIEAWTVQLLAVACLSVAAKIEEVDVPLVEDLQIGNPSYLFEGKLIQKMEMLLLHHLDWKIRAYTPCNFIDYFLRKINGVEFPSPQLITRSIQVISSTVRGIDFLEFKPSEIAAAVAIYVSEDLHLEAMDIENALSGFIGVEKERVMKCLESIQELKPFEEEIFPLNSSNSSLSTTTTYSSMLVSGSNSSSMPQSPSGVLDALSFNYKSDERTVESCSGSSHTSPETKRRRLEMSVRGGEERSDSSPKS